jgi:glutamine amidotransferase-like uncharacterized protein
MKPTIALFLHQPKCSIQCGNGMIKSLSDHYRFKIFTRHSVEKDFFDDVDIVAFPGGEGDSESYKYLLKENGPRVKQFVQQGGKYLGICMGAYWADPYYFNLLDDVRAVQYIVRPGTDTKRPHAKHQRVIWKGQEEHMFFYDGCAFTGLGLDSSDIYSLYPNGDPMAIMQGQLGLIGCHPESEPHWYDSYSWLKGKYHNGAHHELLLDFVNDLIKR